MAITKRVALFYPWRPGNAQEFLRGIFRYARPAEPWEFCLTFGDDISQLLQWKPDGVIGHFFSERAMQAMCRLGLPAVDTAMDCATGDLPQVGLDDRAIGVLAAEHLLDRGFTQFLFVGDPGKEFSRRTFAGFDQRLRLAKRSAIVAPSDWFGAPIDALRPPPNGAVRWLRGLPRPLAAFTAGDHLALQLMEVARASRLRTPEDMAVLGAYRRRFRCG